MVLVNLVSKETLKKLSAHGHNLKGLLAGSRIAFKCPKKEESEEMRQARMRAEQIEYDRMMGRVTKDMSGEDDSLSKLAMANVINSLLVVFGSTAAVFIICYRFMDLSIESVFLQFLLDL